MKKANYENAFVTIVVVVFICVKLYFIYQSELNGAYRTAAAMTNGDAGHFLRIGKNIADFNVYSDTNSSIVSEEATWRTPLWPFILSIFFRITDNITVIIALKAFFEFGLLAFIFRKIFKVLQLKPIHFLPFLLILIEPQYLKYSITFLTESLTAILLLLLVIYFISPRLTKTNTIIISILSGLLLLCHPILVFCVVSILGFFLLYTLKKSIPVALAGGLIFIIIVLSWPLRNAATFHKGFYLTASQGATFSKGWNEKVVTDFNNVDGDMADESKNLKFVSKEQSSTVNGILETSKLYREATLNFISTLDTKQIVQIAAIKLKSNFNPFPERPKKGFLESASSLFRCLYLLNFIFLFFRILKWRKFDFNSITDKVYLVILSIFIGQFFMSIYFYTGIRFNAVYSLTSLFCFLYLVMSFLQKRYKKTLPFS